MIKKEEKAQHDRISDCINFLVTYMPTVLLIALFIHYKQEKPGNLIYRVISGTYLLFCIIFIKILIMKYQNLVKYAHFMLRVVCMVVLLEDAF